MQHRNSQLSGITLGFACDVFIYQEEVPGRYRSLFHYTNGGETRGDKYRYIFEERLTLGGVLVVLALDALGFQTIITDKAVGPDHIHVQHAHLVLLPAAVLALDEPGGREQARER